MFFNQVGGQIIGELGQAHIRAIKCHHPAKIIVGRCGDITLVIHHLSDLAKRIIDIRGPDSRLAPRKIDLFHRGHQLTNIRKGLAAVTLSIGKPGHKLGLAQTVRPKAIGHQG